MEKAVAYRRKAPQESIPRPPRFPCAPRRVATHDRRRSPLPSISTPQKSLFWSRYLPQRHPLGVHGRGGAEFSPFGADPGPRLRTGNHRLHVRRQSPRQRLGRLKALAAVPHAARSVVQRSIRRVEPPRTQKIAGNPALPARPCFTLCPRPAKVSPAVSHHTEARSPPPHGPGEPQEAEPEGPG